ncbi:hypothetical protein DL546_000127 [Coniochaeta pulveracea]|uniref:Uncharacterized protein n=1 Tax=Coniochaeta pulveracea TaxID=177199 RepID=A0A420XVY2_9PEZI|nr:hypothetical protein DL546_000127 [Coniochaeta pulveracea]
MDDPPPPVYEDVVAPQDVMAYIATNRLTGEERGETFEETLLFRLEELKRDQHMLAIAISRVHRRQRSFLRRLYLRMRASTSEPICTILRFCKTSLDAARSLERQNPTTLEERMKAAEHRRRAEWALEAHESLLDCLYVNGDVGGRYAEICFSKPSFVGPLDIDHLKELSTGRV